MIIKTPKTNTNPNPHSYVPDFILALSSHSSLWSEPLTTESTGRYAKEIIPQAGTVRRQPTESAVELIDDLEAHLTGCAGDDLESGFVVARV